MEEIGTNLSALNIMLPMLLPGASGGLVSFLLALKARQYKNNRLIAKSTIEICGGAITAGFIAYLFIGSSYVWVLAFVIGTAWSQILQGVRARVTRMVLAALGEVVDK
jgi:hypothetical protein